MNPSSKAAGRPCESERRMSSGPHFRDVRRLEARVGGGRVGALCGEDGVCELEESVSHAAEASVERATQGAKGIERFHDAPIMRSPRVSRILSRQRS
jgi:hypothetical protein